MRFILPLLLVAACSSPGVRFIGVAPAQVDVDGWRIDVYSDGERAQAIRMTRELNVRPAVMGERGRIAVEQATGCRLDGRTVKFDTNVLDGRLICDDAPRRS